MAELPTHSVDSPVARGSRIVEEGMRELGIRHVSTSEPAYGELRERAMGERLEKCERSERASRPLRT